MPTIFLNKNQYASNGGKEMVLTQTQYDNLSEQDKMNGMTYYICDADSDKNGDFQPVIYSTNEKEIGVWCDGKPLYQKTISFTIPSNNWDYFDIASDIDTVINYTGVVNSGNSFNHIFFNRYDSGDTTFYTTIVIQNGDKKLFFRTYIAMNNCIAYITIYYTKTTDTPGSGSWTPSGVPAVHYSTDEQVIGTWVDGSTLYEKTIVSNDSLPYRTWTTIFSETGANIHRWEGKIYINSTKTQSLHLDYHRGEGTTHESCCTMESNNAIKVSQSIINGTTYGYELTVQYTKS